MKQNRPGFTLIELLIIIAILAVLMGLLMGAIQRVRSTASSLEDKNKLKQIMLAMHQFAGQENGKLPAANGDTMDGTEKFSPHWAIMPYLASGPPPYYRIVNHAPHWDVVEAFYSKLDLSHKWEWAEDNFSDGKISFAYSAPAFSHSAKLPGSFPDGTSQTVGFAEHYNFTSKRANSMGISVVLDSNNLDSTKQGSRTPSFADPAWKDWRPILTEDGTGHSYPDPHPIQIVPSFANSDGTRLQALQSSGLKVAMMDGSVRAFSPAITPPLFWAFVTPNGGEIVGE